MRSRPETEETGTESKTEIKRSRGGIPLPDHPVPASIFFLFMPALQAIAVHKQTGLFDFSNSGHSQLLLVTNPAVYGRNRLALKKIISVSFQSLSFKFLNSINLIDQVDSKTF